MPHSAQAAPTGDPSAVHSRAVIAGVTEWFDKVARDLLWRREDCSAWGVLVSEVMLQQTPVVRVEPVWHQWMQRWPTPADLASASQADAVRAWGRLGYPRRAQRLWQCARVLVDDFDGAVPSSEEDLRSLPGIGDYTAAAVATFAYGRRALALDTNVRRVLARVWHAQPLPALHLTRRERDEAQGLWPKNPAAAARWNAGVMELGALVCTSRAPACQDCPIAESCAWFAAGTPGLDQAPRRTQAWHGTDRQVRGTVMALLRAASSPVNVSGHAAVADIEPGQLDRCLESLLTDELITMVDPDRGTYRL